MELTLQDEATLVDHEDAILRIAIVVAQTAIDSGTLNEAEADDFVDEIADLLAIDMDAYYAPAEQGAYCSSFAGADEAPHPTFGIGNVEGLVA